APTGQENAIKVRRAKADPKVPCGFLLSHKQELIKMVYDSCMRTNIDIDDGLVNKARKLTRLKTKRQIVDHALELLVRSESRKGILRHYGSGIWKGDLKAMRRKRG